MEVRTSCKGADAGSIYAADLFSFHTTSVRGRPRFPVKTVEDPTSEGGICHIFMMKSWQMYSFDDKFVEFGSVLLSLQTVNIYKVCLNFWL